MSDFKPDFDRLPVPEHTPSFWDGLEHELRDEAGPRRIPGWVWAPVAAGVAILVGLGTAGILRGTTGTIVPVGAPTTTVASGVTTDVTNSNTPQAEFVEDGVPAPWALDSLPVSQVPAVLADQWNRAENRAWCRAVYPESLLGRTDVRSAEFGGGWAIAFDTPVRSALGVAGAGITPQTDQATRWPHRIRFADGTVFGWGGEGFDEGNSKRLGELALPGQGCVYQLWSEVGDDALIGMAKSLRTVDGLGGSNVELRGVSPVEDLGPAPWAAAPVALPDWAAGMTGSVSGPIPVLHVPPELAAARSRPLAPGTGVAWDLPDGPGHDAFNRPCADCGRGVMGIDLSQWGSPAPLQSEPEAGTRRLAWDDGSTAVVGYYVGWNALPPDEPQSYDPENGEAVSPGYRATITIAGHGTFEVWSHLGEDHLMRLLESIRLTS